LLLPPGSIIKLTVLAGMNCLAQFALVAVGSTYMAIICPIVICVLYLLQRFYLRTSRQMRFLYLESKSPLYTHFAETLEGISTIRAFGWQQHFANTNRKYLDISQQPYYLLFCIQRWFNLFLLLIVSITAVAVIALATSLISSTSPSKLGVSLSSVTRFNENISRLMRFWIQLETSLGAISRIKCFEEGTPAENKERETFVPSTNWPSRGAIKFTDVSASYG
jgi:ATP-binding cassette subfamily C (CFTR/MRP) protein 1